MSIAIRNMKFFAMIVIQFDGLDCHVQHLRQVLWVGYRTFQPRNFHPRNFQALFSTPNFSIPDSWLKSPGLKSLWLKTGAPYPVRPARPWPYLDFEKQKAAAAAAARRHYRGLIWLGRTRRAGGAPECYPYPNQGQQIMPTTQARLQQRKTCGYATDHATLFKSSLFFVNLR